MKRALCVLKFLCLGNLLQGSNYSHITAFFNRFALEEKALSSTQYGVIVGCYCFVMMFVAPLTAKLMSLGFFKDKTILLAGWTIDASFCLIMSLSQKLQPGLTFFAGCLTTRILEAAGCAIGIMMMFVIVGSELNEINHIVIPLLETIYGVSLVTGPALSGILFDLGGFPLPFWVLGGTLMSLVLLAVFLFPRANTAAAENKKLAKKTIGVKDAYQSTIFVNVLCTMNSLALISSNDSTLALQLHNKFGMTATESGRLFLCAGGLYATSSLLTGFVSKKISDPRHLVMGGFLLCLVSLILAGPLVPIEQTKEIVVLSQILLGLGAGPVFVCSYLQSLKYLANANEGTKEMYASLSSIFTPAASIGATIGPLVSGAIRQYYSYETLIAVSAVQTASITMLLFLKVCVDFKRSRVSSCFDPT